MLDENEDVDDALFKKQVAPSEAAMPGFAENDGPTGFPTKSTFTH
jgi:hypothetical protein